MSNKTLKKTVKKLGAEKGEWCCHSVGQSTRGGKMILLNKKYVFVSSQQIF